MTRREILYCSRPLFLQTPLCRLLTWHLEDFQKVAEQLKWVLIKLFASYSLTFSAFVMSGLWDLTASLISLAASVLVLRDFSWPVGALCGAAKTSFFLTMFNNWLLDKALHKFQPCASVATSIKDDDKGFLRSSTKIYRILQDWAYHNNFNDEIWWFHWTSESWMLILNCVRQLSSILNYAFNCIPASNLNCFKYVCNFGTTCICNWTLIDTGSYWAASAAECSILQIDSYHPEFYDSLQWDNL